MAEKVDAPDSYLQILISASLPHCLKWVSAFDQLYCIMTRSPTLTGTNRSGQGRGATMSSPIIDKIMNEQDRDFIRVLEDLIDVLVARGVITMEMLPPDAREKLATRRQMRDSLREPVGARPGDISGIDQKLAALRFKE